MRKIIHLILLFSFLYIGLYAFHEQKLTENAITKQKEIRAEQEKKRALFDKQLALSDKAWWLSPWATKMGMRCSLETFIPSIGSRCKLYVNEYDWFWCESGVICLSTNNIFDDYNIQYKYAMIFSVLWVITTMASFFFLKKK